MRESLLKGPAVFPFVECPNCKQLLEVGAALCPRCREEIRPEYAEISAAVVHYNTQACSVANTIATFNAFIPLALIGTILIYLGEAFVFGKPRISVGLLFWPSIPLFAIVIWYLRFGRFRIGDEEYERARREMRRSFAFWLAFLIVDLLLMVVAWSTMPAI
jgi:RNA polymerase subunit RPABC4/transcription elongation factor Spt4